LITIQNSTEIKQSITFMDFVFVPTKICCFIFFILRRVMGGGGGGGGGGYGTV